MRRVSLRVVSVCSGPIIVKGRAVEIWDQPRHVRDATVRCWDMAQSERLSALSGSRIENVKLALEGVHPHIALGSNGDFG